MDGAELAVGTITARGVAAIAEVWTGDGAVVLADDVDRFFLFIARDDDDRSQDRRRIERSERRTTV